MAEIRAARKLEEVARLAGVSVSTVSRTLAGKEHVSAKARKKVLEAADKLDYRPNVMARMLKLGRSSSIAVMIPSIDNLIYPAFVRGVQDVASQNGYMLSICNTDEDKDIEENFIRSSCNMGVAGLIVSTIRSDSEHLTKLRDEGFPIVLAIRELDGDFDTIVARNSKGAYDMTAYLLGKGCRHIALVVGDLGLSLYHQRHEGYMKALEDAGVAYNPDLVLDSTGQSPEMLSASVGNLLDRHPHIDAIFATNDFRAIVIMQALKKRGVRIPEDIKVAGFDDVEISSFVDPPLTTVHQPLYNLGAEAARCLIEQISAKDRGIDRKRIHRVLDTELVVRQST